MNGKKRSEEKRIERIMYIYLEVVLIDLKVENRIE